MPKKELNGNQHLMKTDPGSELNSNKNIPLHKFKPLCNMQHSVLNTHIDFVIRIHFHCVCMSFQSYTDSNNIGAIYI